MKYYDLAISIKLEETIHYSKAYLYLNSLVNKVMLEDSILKELHKKNNHKSKLYVFSNLYPIELDREYKKDKVYKFNLRTVDLDFVLKLQYILQKKEICTNIELKEYKYKFITELETITPAVSVLNTTTESKEGTKPQDRYWSNNQGLDLIMQRIYNNADKKAKQIFGDNFQSSESFIEGIEVSAPMNIPYKGINLLTHKFNLKIKSDITSQKLAWTVLATGLLEKNALGLGLCRAK